nr:unnamed protein product [Callosobruchus chinensis]
MSTKNSPPLFQAKT